MSQAAVLYFVCGMQVRRARQKGKGAARFMVDVAPQQVNWSEQKERRNVSLHPPDQGGHLASRQPRLAALTDTHVSRHICWPQDLDMLLELNNGLALTLYDLERIAMAQRVGLVTVLRLKRWGLTMAGSHVRFRQRIRGFEQFEVRSRAMCDDKFVYIEQSMWKQDGTCASHVLYRAAVTDRNGIVAPPLVLAALEQDGSLPRHVRLDRSVDQRGRHQTLAANAGSGRRLKAFLAP